MDRSDTALPAPADFTRTAVRAWWADGLWDLALAGFWLITALWVFPLIRTAAFPSWTWPWPFLTRETDNPLAGAIGLWTAALFLIWAVYIFLARLAINLLKRRLIAPRLGDVRHSFLLPVGRGFAVVFLLVYLAGIVLLGGLLWGLKGGPRIYDVFVIAAFAGAIFLVGWRFRIRRYLWMSAVGTVLCLLAEMITTNAIYRNGPRNFLDVSPLYGNPSLVCLVWTAVLLVGGTIALLRTLRLPRAEAG
jgi:hypothetical protein